MSYLPTSCKHEYDVKDQYWSSCKKCGNIVPTLGANPLKPLTIQKESYGEALEEIYSLMPEYWCVWKNRFGGWSIGEANNQMSATDTFSNLQELLVWVRNKFCYLPF